MRGAYVYPVMTPAVWYPNAWTDEEADVTPTGDERAKLSAASVAESAELDDVTTVGDVGDPATAIMQEAHEHAVDVVVNGSHDRSWFSRLLNGSVEHELLRDAGVKARLSSASGDGFMVQRRPPGRVGHPLGRRCTTPPTNWLESNNQILYRLTETGYNPITRARIDSWG